MKILIKDKPNKCETKQNKKWLVGLGETRK